jgi:GH15 family glucan-1,4-alpha-glucosidase
MKLNRSGAFLNRGRPGAARRVGVNLLGVLAGLLGAIAFFRLLDVFLAMLKQPRLLSRAVVRALGSDERLEDLACSIAADNLRDGIEKRILPGGGEKLVLVAGVRNFREPWARDFGFASYGLLALGEHEAVRQGLEVFLEFQKPDGQFPIKIHSTTVPHRYLHSLFRREQPTTAPIRPKYFSGHQTISLDGNALLLIAALKYVEVNRDEAFLREHWSVLKSGLQWLERHAMRPDGLLFQGPFSDWADSINRQGRVLYTNVLYWKAAAELSAAALRYGMTEDHTAFSRLALRLGESINAHFWRDDLGYFVTSSEFDNLSSSGNLMAIAWGLTSSRQAESILSAMQAFGMAEPVPTKPVHKPYPWRYVAVENRMGGIPHYHTSAAWLWLGAWHVIALARVGWLDDAKTVLDRMAEVIVRDGQVHEVYGTDGHYLSNLLYTSEAPLTWSAGMFVYAYHTYREISQETI